MQNEGLRWEILLRQGYGGQGMQIGDRRWEIGDGRTWTAPPVLHVNQLLGVDSPNGELKSLAPVKQARFEPLSNFSEYPPDKMLQRSLSFANEMGRRRSVRQFSDRPVAREVIENCLRAAVASPSGANRQPWSFVVVCERDLKRRIRQAAEAEEREFYSGRAPKEWLDALAPLGTDDNKAYLEHAPYLIVVFELSHGVKTDGGELKHYYVKESVGIATGILISALHHAGLGTLTHTPGNMRFLSQILNRPARDRPFLMIPVGYPAEGALVPVVSRKPFDNVVLFV